MSEEKIKEEKEVTTEPKKRGRPKKSETVTTTIEAVKLPEETPALDQDLEASNPQDTDIEKKPEPIETSETSNSTEEKVVSPEDVEKIERNVSDENPDYHSFTKEQLIPALEALLNDRPVQNIKNEVEEIKTEFLAKFKEELELKKEEFLAEGGNIIDFRYTTPLKKKFNSLYSDYKEKRSNHYKNLKKDLQANLQRRRDLVDELKGLLNAEENINTTYKHFKDIQDRWRNAGPIPRDKYNIVWNTYHHHVENFYDFLHLNREFRDLDFKHNLEQKLKLISRAEELGTEENINKAFRELQMLHKMWKEEIGPVAKKYREEVWEKFSSATKIVHDKRQAYLVEEEKHYAVNFDTKQQIITNISEVVGNTKPSHQSWQNAIKKVQELRDQYFAAGKVPRSQTKEIWNSFKSATREFNKAKNNFYKNQKKDQYVNLEKKRELIKIANENKESEDFNATTPLMKKIQMDWKQIGHVPRRDSDAIWKEFKGACNHYFDRFHAQKNEASKEEQQHLVDKQKLLTELMDFAPSGDKKADITSVKDKIKAWKEIGRVPYNKKNIERKFGKSVDEAFGKLELDKKESELIKFENKLSSFVSQEDDRKLQNEQFFISKKIDETKNEIRQLENNLGFFQHVEDTNPLVMEVKANIEKHKEQLEVWKVKLSKLKSIRKG